MKARSIYPIAGVILITISTLFFNSCSKGVNGFHSISGLVWNTEFHITYQGEGNFEDSVLSVMNKVGKSLSVFDSTSLVSKVNGNLSTPVDSDFIKVYNMSLEINRLSRRKFDPTLSPLITAWGFGPGHKATSDTARIDSILQFVGISKTRLSGNNIVKDDIRTQFNFSAIAKGYGCDCVADMFRRNGIKNYLIEIGGEIVASGCNPTGGKWRISIDRPVYSDSTPSHESQAIIEFTDMGIATSGNYRNFHTEGSRRYGHTILPSTGRPVQTDVLSATVLAPSAMVADGLATTFMAVGGDDAKVLCDSLGYPAMLIMSDSAVWYSDKFKSMMLE